MVTERAKWSKSLLVVFLLTAFAAFLLFRPAFSAYFFQDDWFSFSISKATNLFEFMAFFSPNPNLIYYRPLGMQVPFFIVRTLFGLNPLPFRIVTFLLHLGNSFLTYTLLLHFFKDRRLASLGMFFYATSAIHLTVFYWAATLSFVLAPTFYLGSLLFYLNGKRGVSLIIFLLGLLTNELLLTLPLVLSLWDFRFSHRSVKQSLWFWVVSLLYVGLRVRFLMPLGGMYAVTADPEAILRTIRIYLLWSFQWPEEINNHFVSFARLNSLFVKIYWVPISVFTGLTLLLLTFWYTLPILTYLRQRKLPRRYLRVAFFGGGFFLFTLLPVLFLSHHAFAYYLPIPFLGLLLSGLSLFKAWTESLKLRPLCLVAIGVVFLLCWYGAALVNVNFNLIHHWAPRRSAISRKLIEAIKHKYPILPDGAIVVIPRNPDKTNNNQWALANDEGLQVTYNSPTLRTFFGSEEEFLKTFSKEKQLKEEGIKMFTISCGEINQCF